MTFILSDDLRKAVDETGNAPVKLVHPVTKKVYLLVSEENYEQIKPLFEEDPMTPDERRFLLQRAGNRADWDSPEMDAYDHYDEHRRNPES